jgi:uncharacterized protein YndB with AHSA1/START domain
MRERGLGRKAFRIASEYRSVERPHLLVFTWLPDWHPNAKESPVRFDLQEKDGITRVRLTHSRLPTKGARAHKGWRDILEWLRAYVEETSHPGV